MGNVNIVVVGQGQEFDSVRFLAGATRFGEIRAVSVNDMVDKILAKLRPGDRITSLNIIDHGNQYGQGIGTSFVTPSNLSSTSLFKLRPLFATDAVVTLQGCLVGRNEGLIQALSTLWGVKVRAGTTYQRPLYPGLEGGVRECMALKCTVTGGGFVEWLDGKLIGFPD